MWLSFIEKRKIKAKCLNKEIITAFDFTVFISLIRPSLYYSQLKQYNYFLFARKRSITFLSWSHHPKLSFLCRISITDTKYYFDLKGIYDTTILHSTNLVEVFWAKLIKEQVYFYIFISISISIWIFLYPL